MPKLIEDIFTARARDPRPKAHTRPLTRPSIEPVENRRLLSTTILAPTNLTAAGSSATSITLQWTGVHGYQSPTYEVLERIFVKTSGPKGSSSGYYKYNTIGSAVTATQETLSGLVAGSSHSYVVEAITASGTSPYSNIASSSTWVAPSLARGSGFLLSSGAVYSSPVNITAGLTTQVTVLVAGNPLTFSMQSGPSTASVNPKTGVITYTPAASEVGSVNVLVQISNPLGSVTQTIPFNVLAPNTSLLKPKLKLSNTQLNYTGQIQSVSATAIGTDGSPVNGTLAIAYNGGGGGAPLKVGSYGVLATFTSYDPAYADATVLGTVTVSKATPAFNYITSPTFAAGTATTTITGSIWANYSAFPSGDTVTATIQGVPNSSIGTATSDTSIAPTGNSVIQTATVDSNGNFSMTFPTATLPKGTHKVGFLFAGDANFNSVRGTGSITVIAGAAPKITLNPKKVTTTVGDPATFTAAASGSNIPTVQWQVSSDGGLTFSNIFNATSTTLSFAASLGQTGYYYRAIFTNQLGTATTTAAKLTVQGDTGGG